MIRTLDSYSSPDVFLLGCFMNFFISFLCVSFFTLFSFLIIRISTYFSTYFFSQLCLTFTFLVCLRGGQSDLHHHTCVFLLFLPLFLFLCKHARHCYIFVMLFGVRVRNTVETLSKSECQIYFLIIYMLSRNTIDRKST